MGTTTTHFIPYPEPADIPNIPQDMRSLAEKVDSSIRTVEVLQCTSTTRPTGGDRAAGRFIYETDTKAYGLWDGTAWKIWDTVEQNYTTTWAANGTSSGLSLGSGGFIDSHYTRQGGRCDLNIRLSVGSSGFGGGVGRWTFTAPFPAARKRGSLTVKAWAPNAGGDFIGHAWIDPPSSTINMVVTAANNNPTMVGLQNCNLQAQPGTGYPYAPGNYTWTTVGDVTIYGNYPI